MSSLFIVIAANPDPPMAICEGEVPRPGDTLSVSMYAGYPTSPINIPGECQFRVVSITHQLRNTQRVDEAALPYIQGTEPYVLVYVEAIDEETARFVRRVVEAEK